MNVYEVIRRPLVTEKGVHQEGNRAHAVFRSARDANKTQIKQAVEKFFKVKVAEVRTEPLRGQAAPARHVHRLSRRIGRRLT